jgi:hypothetical protein
MKTFIAMLFALVPSVAMGQEMNKDDMIMEFKDIASLSAAEVLGCGETKKETVRKFNVIFDIFMLDKAKEEGYDVDIGDIEGWKLTTLLVQYGAMKGMECKQINDYIDDFSDTARYVENMYAYYTPNGAI